jgi:hypothetical protein
MGPGPGPARPEFRGDGAYLYKDVEPPAFSESPNDANRDRFMPVVAEDDDDDDDADADEEEDVTTASSVDTTAPAPGVYTLPMPVPRSSWSSTGAKPFLAKYVFLPRWRHLPHLLANGLSVKHPSGEKFLHPLQNLTTTS